MNRHKLGGNVNLKHISSQYIQTCCFEAELRMHELKIAVLRKKDLHSHFWDLLKNDYEQIRFK